MQTKTKQDLIDRVAQMTQQRRFDVKRTVSKFLEVMVEELATGNRIEFREFGVFENRGRRGRTAQNPRTGEIVNVPPRRTVKFKVSRQVRERLEEMAQEHAEMQADTADAPVEKAPPARARRAPPRNRDEQPEIKVKPKRAARAGV